MTKPKSVREELEFTEEQAEVLMHGWLRGPTSDLQSNLGHFIMWFGTAEMFLTRLLAFLVGMNNMKTFDLLCKGMDARVKCERLRKAAKQAHPLGPIFTDQLSRFEQKSIAVRNKVSHSWPVLDNGTIYFCNVKTGAFRPENFEKDGTEMLATDLFMEGLWLNAFSKNVCSAINNVSSGGPLEVVFDGQSPPQEAQ